jgi:hypothetical protein
MMNNILLGVLAVFLLLALRVFSWHQLLERIDRVMIWLASFLSDPVTQRKGSITRLCGLLATLAAIWCAWATFAFARVNTGATGVIGILAGLTGTLLTAAAAKFFLRTTPTGMSEPVDNTPEPVKVSGGDITIKQEIKP